MTATLSNINIRELLNKVTTMARHMIWRPLGVMNEPEDVAAEVTADVLRNLEKLAERYGIDIDDSEALMRFAIGVARQQIKWRVAKLLKGRPEPLNLIDASYEGGNQVEPPSALVLADVQTSMPSAVIKRAERLLTPVEKVVTAFVVLEGLSYSATADALQMSADAVRRVMLSAADKVTAAAAEELHPASWPFTSARDYIESKYGAMSVTDYLSRAFMMISADVGLVEQIVLRSHGSYQPERPRARVRRGGKTWARGKAQTPAAVEQEVLRRVAAGQTNIQVARDPEMPTRTTVQRIVQRWRDAQGCDCKSRDEVRNCIRMALLEEPS